MRWAGATALLALAVLASREIILRNRDWRDDKSFFTVTLAQDPRASYMRTSFGAIEWSDHKSDDAVRDWQMALADKPDNAIALSDLGMAAVERRQWQAAQGYLRQAVGLKPRFMAPHLHLGKMYLALGRTADAEVELERAVDISPLSPEARNQLGKLYLQQGRTAAAEQQLRASLEGERNAEALDGLGDILTGEGRRDEAIRCWQEALRLSPFDEHAHIALGGAYRTQGKASDAEREYRAALLLDPNNPEALAGMRALKPEEFPGR